VLCGTLRVWPHELTAPGRFLLEVRDPVPHKPCRGVLRFVLLALILLCHNRLHRRVETLLAMPNEKVVSFDDVHMHIDTTACAQEME
jgi:hypothetical protein